MCLRSPSELFTIAELGVEEISSTAKMLAAVGDIWRTGICEKVEGLSVWIELDVTVKEVTDILL
jgi:hypothetical protein